MPRTKRGARSRGAELSLTPRQERPPHPGEAKPSRKHDSPSLQFFVLIIWFCFHLASPPCQQHCRVNLLFSQSHRPKVPPSLSLLPPHLQIYLKKQGGKLIAQNIFNFNFKASITHSYFGKAQGTTLLLILLPLDPTFTSLQLNTMSCQSHTRCHNPLVESKRDLGMAKHHCHGPNLAGFLGQEPVPKLSKLLGPTCKSSNAFVFLSLPILLAGFGLQHFGLELNMAKFQPQGPASQSKAHMPGGHIGRRDIYSLLTARTSKSSQKGFPWLERHNQPK